MGRTAKKALLMVALTASLVAGCNPTGARSSAKPEPSPAPSSSPSFSVSPRTTRAICDPSGISSPTAFHQGLATIDITTGDKATATLDRIADSTFYARFELACPAGAQAEWTDSSDQWLLTVLASVAPNGAWSAQFADLWIERYADEPPLYADGSTCSITITEDSPSGLAGFAECHDLQWLNDYVAQTNPDGASPLPNLPPFNATIRFEARP